MRNGPASVAARSTPVSGERSGSTDPVEPLTSRPRAARSPSGSRRPGPGRREPLGDRAARGRLVSGSTGSVEPLLSPETGVLLAATLAGPFRIGSRTRLLPVVDRIPQPESEVVL